MLRPYLKIWDWDLIFSRAVQWWLFPHLASVVRLHWHSKVTFGKTAGSVFLKHLRNFKSFKIQSTYFFYFDFYLKFLFLPSQFRWGWGWGELICITQALNLICIWIRQCRRFPQFKGKSYNFSKLCHIFEINSWCNSIQPIFFWLKYFSSFAAVKLAKKVRAIICLTRWKVL